MAQATERSAPELGGPMVGRETELAALRRFLKSAGGTGRVIWATGYRRSYPWLNLDVLGDDGEIVHRRGITPVNLASRIVSRRSAASLPARDRCHLPVEGYAADVA